MTAKSLRLAFAGTPDLAAHVLNRLLCDTSHRITTVFTQPDRRAGRGRKTRISPVKSLAEAHKIHVEQPSTSSDLEQSGALANTDALIVVAYGLILPLSILHIPGFGCLNIHTSLLPRWRGAAPIQRAIEHGDSETGVSIMQMDAGLDTGPVLAQKSCPVDDRETAGTLHDKLARLGADAIIEALDTLINGTASYSEQDESRATYARKISKQEAEINWNRSAIELDSMIRAFNPAPIAHTTLNGQTMRIWEAVPGGTDSPQVSPGTILRCDSGGIEVACNPGTLIIKTLQIPGKRPMSADQFLHGRADFGSTDR